MPGRIDMPKYLQDLCSGAVFICIGLAFGLQYSQLSGVSRIFPEALISLISLGGFYYFIKGFVRRGKEKAEGTGEAESKERFLFMRLVYILFSALMLIFLIEYLGFYSASFLFLFISHAYLANKKNGKMKTMRDGLVFSLAFVSAVWFLFHYVLLVPTPAGFLI